MADHQIIPDKVTKPIQLLAAWLVGLIVVNGTFLLAAQQITRPEWASGLLVICAVLNVPVFIFALFLLQTKFRPQMQEDSYYSQYLERENYNKSTSVRENSAQVVEKEIVEATEKIVSSLGQAGLGKEKPIEQILREAQFEVLLAKVGKSRALAELYKSPELWESFVQKYGKLNQFRRDIDLLVSEGVVREHGKGHTIKLTELGKKVALAAEKNGTLLPVRSEEFWARTRRTLQNLKSDEENDEENLI